MQSGNKRPTKFGQSSHVVSADVIPAAVLRQARKSGQLNLSSRGLKTVPDVVWKVNAEPVGSKEVSFDTEDRWWDQTVLVKLILASNELTELSEDISLLPALTVLDAHNNQLRKLPLAIGELKQLTRLMLSHNQLADLGEGLGALENLQCLRVDHNQFRHLHDDITMLSHLEQLDISHNQLSKLPAAMGELQSLRHLSLDHNQLTALPVGMKYLQELTASYNKISDTPQLEQCPNLERVDLRNNSIPEFPSILPGTKLKELLLGGNKITIIPGNRLLPLVVMVMLDLRDNKITSVPDQLSTMTSLERLDLSNNDITRIPYSIGKLNNLKSLGLDGNPLKSIRRDIANKGTLEILKHLRSRMDEGDDNTNDNAPATLPSSGDKLIYSGKKSASIDDQFWEHPNAPSVTTIDVSRNQLTSFPEKLLMFTCVSELQLSFNKLTLIPEEISHLVHLTSLDLRSNQLTDLPNGLASCHKLREICLSMNRLKALPRVLYSINSLENVFASDNQITDINVDGLLQLPMISCLDLQNNDISQVPPQLGNVSTLRSLMLSGNPFRQPRANILAKGTTTLLEYLRDRIPQ
ncbi:leucine-rich repeat-containing protein 40-like isoform X2 [Dysidea avara]